MLLEFIARAVAGRVHATPVRLPVRRFGRSWLLRRAKLSESTLPSNQLLLNEQRAGSPQTADRACFPDPEPDAWAQ